MSQSQPCVNRAGTRACIPKLSQTALWLGLAPLLPLAPELSPAWAHATQEADSLLIEAVTDVALLGRGRVLILDAMAAKLIIADSQLRPMSSYGRRGSGPGEFREPVAAVMVSPERVAVLDRALRRVTILSVLDGGRTLGLVRMFSLKIPSEGMCALGTHQLLVYGYSAGMRLHVVEMDGTVNRSFAPADARSSGLARDLLTAGRIACHKGLDEVLVTRHFSPTVEGFQISSGRRTWIDSLRPFRSIVVIDNGVSVTFASGTSGPSKVISVFLDSGLRVFQAEYDSSPGRTTVDTIATYAFSVRRKRWERPQFDLPLLASVGNRRAISIGWTTSGDFILAMKTLAVRDDRDGVAISLSPPR